MKPLLHIDESELRSLGIIDWGYTEDPLPAGLDRFQQWINAGLYGPLNYLSDHRRPLRGDIRKVYSEFQSALVFLFSYQSAKKWMIENNRHELAAYTLGFGGEDYHYALKRKLELVSSRLADKIPGLSSSLSLDIQPVLERDLAYRAGLGWFGKNSMLINQKEGSYFIIGSLLLNQKLPIKLLEVDVDHCGQCNACVEACPTNAINPQTRTLTADKCISTFTIEIFKESDPPQGMENSRGEIFGCDICQDVCPWNRKPLQKVEAKLELKEPYSFLKTWFFQWTKEKLRQHMEKESNRGLKKSLFGTAFDRPGRAGWLKNFK